MSTSPNSSATQSTNKANSYLLARRRERRNKNRPIDRLIEKRGETTTPPSTEIKVLPKETPSAATTTSTSERRKDQGEKAYNYLSQRRAKRRHRHPIMTQPQKTETASIVEELVEPILSELKPQRLIVLVSIGVSDRTQASNQSRAMTLLQARGTPYVEVDGMDPTQRERRNELFIISGIRANYPQFFLEQKDGTTAFVGAWEALEGINDSSSYPAETIEAHPNIRTWDRVFGNLVQSFD